MATTITNSQINASKAKIESAWAWLDAQRTVGITDTNRAEFDKINKQASLCSDLLITAAEQRFNSEYIQSDIDANPEWTADQIYKRQIDKWNSIRYLNSSINNLTAEIARLDSYMLGK